MDIHTAIGSLDGHKHLEADNADRPPRSSTVYVFVARTKSVFNASDLCTADRKVAKALRIKCCKPARS